MMAGLHFQVLTEGMYLGMNALIQSKETSQSVNLRCSSRTVPSGSLASRTKQSNS